MVLSWSRRIFLRFFLDARMENFMLCLSGLLERVNTGPAFLAL
jgi:hypothetical protein